MATPTDFKLRFTEFASTADARVQLFLDDAALTVDATAWGARYDLGLCYLAAHLLTIAARGGAGAAGALTQVKVGDLSRNYAQTTGISGPYATTSYGVEFLRLQKTILRSPSVL